MASNLNENFWKWFKGSVVVNSDGSPRVMYHGTSQEFDTFDPAKIKAVDTDAPFNGFWFSSDENTSPAFHNAKSVKAVYLAIKNPAPWQVWRKVAKEVYAANREGTIDPRSRSVNDEVRHRLGEMGYDGILFEGHPEINADELEQTGRTEFRNTRGAKLNLRKEKRKEVEWRDVIDTHTYPEAEVIRQNGTREPLKMDLSSIAALVVNSPGVDVSKFDFSTLVGEIVLPNGDRIESKSVTRDFPTKDWVHTGKEVDEIGYYDGNEHIISYESLEAFIHSHETVWVCFYPNQIKSVSNSGAWSPSNGNINEGLRGWIDIVVGK